MSRFAPPGTPFTRQRAHDFRTAPGPWAPSVNVPAPMRSMGVPLVMAHRFPKQDRTATLRALADTRDYGFDPNVMLVPRMSVQARGTGPNGMQTIAKAQAHLSSVQQRVLNKYLAGHALAPAEVQELFRVRVPAGSTSQADSRRAFALRRPNNPAARSGARQIPFDPTFGNERELAMYPSAGSRRAANLARGVVARQSGKLGFDGPPLVGTYNRAVALTRAGRRVFGGPF